MNKTTKGENELVIRAVENHVRWMTDDMREKTKGMEIKQRVKFMDMFNKEMYGAVIGATELINIKGDAYNIYDIVIKDLSITYRACLEVAEEILQKRKDS